MVLIRRLTLPHAWQDIYVSHLWQLHADKDSINCVLLRCWMVAGGMYRFGGIMDSGAG